MSLLPPPPPPPNRKKLPPPPPPELLSRGAISLTLMPSGTPHSGLKVTNCIDAEKVGVGVAGLPTTIFS